MNKPYPVLAYFEKWANPVGARIIEEAGGIDLQRLRFADTEISLAGLQAAHGFHMSPAVEMPDVYYPTRELIENCSRLLAVSSTGAGYDIVDVQACTDNGVLLFNQTGSNSQSVAEHVVGMIIALSKNIAQTDKLMRRRSDYQRDEVAGTEISSKTVGIIGLGNIGRIVARMLGQGFNMNVIACDPFIDADECMLRGARKVSLDELLAQSDFVTVHTPKTTETRNMMNTESFGKMKPGSVFINTARGGIHNEHDLEKALDSGHIAAAGLDVFEKEPPSTDHPLLNMQNVMASPHIAGITHEANYNMAESAATQWVALLAGRKPSKIVNTDVWSRYRERFESIMGFAPEA